MRGQRSASVLLFAEGPASRAYGGQGHVDAGEAFRGLDAEEPLANGKEGGTGGLVLRTSVSGDFESRRRRGLQINSKKRNAGSSSTAQAEAEMRERGREKERRSSSSCSPEIVHPLFRKGEQPKPPTRLTDAHQQAAQAAQLLLVREQEHTLVVKASHQLSLTHFIGLVFSPPPLRRSPVPVASAHRKQQQRCPSRRKSSRRLQRRTCSGTL